MSDNDKVRFHYESYDDITQAPFYRHLEEIQTLQERLRNPTQHQDKGYVISRSFKRKYAKVLIRLFKVLADFGLISINESHYIQDINGVAIPTQTWAERICDFNCFKLRLRADVTSIARRPMYTLEFNYSGFSGCRWEICFVENWWGKMRLRGLSFTPESFKPTTLFDVEELLTLALDTTCDWVKKIASAKLDLTGETK